MESSFGHDFGRVRVHDDSAAADLARASDAIAFTRGQHLYFGANQYRPWNLEGRALIGHELAHTIQQQRPSNTQPPDASSAVAAGSHGLEKAAEHAGIGAAFGNSVHVPPALEAPAIQFRRVTEGGFGQEVEAFTKDWGVSDRAVDVLNGMTKMNPTFPAMSKTLDDHYVSAHDTDITSKRPDLKNVDLNLGPDGTIQDGPAWAKGKRKLFILDGAARFEPVGSASNLWKPDEGLRWATDKLFVGAGSVAQFVQDLAHEATHALRFVTGAAPNPKDVADAVQIGLQEEKAARTTEAAVVGQLPKADRREAAPVGPLTDREIQRDISPGFNLTYLEMFFFDFELQEAKKAEKLKDEEILDLEDQVERGDKMILRDPQTSNDIYRTSRYGSLLRDRKICADEWVKFDKDHENDNPNDPKVETAREALRQNHAKRFFAGKVSYLP
jgi:hypothetical protein